VADSVLVMTDTRARRPAQIPPSLRTTLAAQRLQGVPAAIPAPRAEEAS